MPEVTEVSIRASLNMPVCQVASISANAIPTVSIRASLNMPVCPYHCCNNFLLTKICLFCCGCNPGFYALGYFSGYSISVWLSPARYVQSGGGLPRQ